MHAQLNRWSRTFPRGRASSLGFCARDARASLVACCVWRIFWIFSLASVARRSGLQLIVGVDEGTVCPANLVLVIVLVARTLLRFCLRCALCVAKIQVIILLPGILDEIFGFDFRRFQNLPFSRTTLIYISCTVPRTGKRKNGNQMAAIGCVVLLVF